jgi:hypothetical protein
MAEHRRRTDENGIMVHERAEDRDAWARLAHTVERYKVLWIVGMVVAGWIGSRIIQPLSAVSVLSAQQVQIITRLDKADMDRRDLADVLKVVVRIQCFQLGANDRAKYNINCADIPLPSIDRRDPP